MARDGLLHEALVSCCEDNKVETIVRVVPGLICNQQVGGSSPLAGTIRSNGYIPFIVVSSDRGKLGEWTIETVRRSDEILIHRLARA